MTATIAAMLQHHAAIEHERAGREGLLSTIGKEWILGPELFPAAHPTHPLGKDGAINYGWHTTGPVAPNGPYLARPDVILWQSRGFRHNRFHVDYSQWVPRFVNPRMRVDGRNVATAEVMMSPELAGLVSYLMSPELAGLVSYQGPLLGVRYPLWEHPALTTSSPSRPASTSRHETSFPLDSSDTTSPSIRSLTFGAMPDGDAEEAGRKEASMHARLQRST